MTSVNVRARSMTRTARVAGGLRVRHVIQSVLTVPAMREQAIRVGPRETVLRIGHVNRVVVPPLVKRVAIASHAEVDNRMPKAKDLCLHGGRVLNVLLVHRRSQVPVRKKRLASVVTSPHARGNTQLRIDHVRWRVRWVDIPVLNVIQVSV